MIIDLPPETLIFPRENEVFWRRVKNDDNIGLLDTFSSLPGRLGSPEPLIFPRENQRFWRKIDDHGEVTKRYVFLGLAACWPSLIVQILRIVHFP